MPKEIKISNECRSYYSPELARVAVEKRVKYDKLVYIITVNDEGRFVPSFTNANCFLGLAKDLINDEWSVIA
jgi:hypothetical protein